MLCWWIRSFGYSHFTSLTGGSLESLFLCSWFQNEREHMRTDPLVANHQNHFLWGWSCVLSFTHSTKDWRKSLAYWKPSVDTLRGSSCIVKSLMPDDPAALYCCLLTHAKNIFRTSREAFGVISNWSTASLRRCWARKVATPFQPLYFSNKGTIAIAL